MFYFLKGLSTRKDKSHKRKIIKPITRKSGGIVKSERCLTRITAPIIIGKVGISISISRVLPSFGERKNIDTI